MGLYFLRARYYDPQAGRFLSHDPLLGNNENPVSLHRYLYTSADPVNRVDPTGRDGELIGTLSAINTSNIGNTRTATTSTGALVYSKTLTTLLVLRLSTVLAVSLVLDLSPDRENKSSQERVVLVFDVSFCLLKTIL